MTSGIRKLNHDEISVNRVKIDAIETAKRMPVVVICSSIRSNYNVGSIFRTSDGAMIEKLYLTGYTPAPPKKEVLKTALGATESVPWEYRTDTLELIQELKSKGYKISALEQTDKSIDYASMATTEFPLCLILGNEITGVAQEYLDLCDFSVEIPQYGMKQSLNVAVAYGISIFEIRKIYETKIGNR